MRIVSLNSWGGAMYDELIAWLPKVDADLLCLQEMPRTPGARGWTQFSDDARTLPQRANLLADIADVLPDYDAWFTVCDAGPVRDEDGIDRREQFGIGMFARAEFPRVASRSAYIHRTYVDHGAQWPESDRPRAAQVARFYDPDRQRHLTLGHLHGLRDAAGKMDTPARRAQARRLAELVASVREPDDLVVVCGDMNVLPDSETFAILAEIGLTDLVRDADTRTSLYSKPHRHASYVLVNDPTAVRHFEIVAEPEVSDHRALLVEL